MKRSDATTDRTAGPGKLPEGLLGSPPWWGRLELRVIAALTLIGTLCVGASAYLVQLTVGYFERRLGSALVEAAEVADSVEPFHQAVVDAQVSAYQARTKALALEIRLAERDGAGQRPWDGLEPMLERLLAREPDIVALTAAAPDGTTVREDREREFPRERYDWFPAEYEGLQVEFRIDPELDLRYQQLGERQREIGLERTALPGAEHAVLRVVMLASATVLVLSLLAGFALARTMTRKASELSRVMRDVARGELSVRARALGRDELGQLALAFNRMLDELQRAQDKLAYLQRIGAWQGMARRIAHEIKNPLTPIQLAAQQLRDKDPGVSPEFSRLLQTSVEIIEDEVEGLRRMVTSFSQFAKVPRVRLEPVGFDRILDEFERAYGHLTDREDDKLTIAGAGPDVKIQGDRQLLKQALVNLVENAVLSAREAGRTPVVVEVSAHARREFVELVVDDNGPGIPADRKDGVFEPYETSRPEGTGLGLAIVKKIVLDHGGEVWVEDAPLGGARFVIRLPRSY